MGPRAQKLGLAAFAIVCAVWLALRANDWNSELALEPPPLASVPPVQGHDTPAVSRRVVLILVDGLGAAEARELPNLEALRARGIGVAMHVPAPTISRPHYVTLMTGVPPLDSGVRTNRVNAPVAVDSLMAHVASGTASDYGSIASLFSDGTFRVVKRTDSIAALGDAVVDLLAKPELRFVPVLVLDVDRAGHAEGVGDAYRAAARDADAMIGRVAAAMDLTRDTLVVTADHGHVARGGHGGTEPEVSTVELVMVGAGVRTGVAAPTPLPADVETPDVAPTVAALLGVASPGHALGHTRDDLITAAPRATDDRARLAALAPYRDTDGRISARYLAAVALILAAVVALRPRLRVRSLVGATALVGMCGATVAITAGHLSPSYVPSLARVQTWTIAGAIASFAIQLALTWLATRRTRDAAWPIAVAGIAVSLLAVASARVFYAPPFYAVPPPFWMVAIPALEIAAAVACAANAVTLVISAARSSPSPSPLPLPSPE